MNDFSSLALVLWPLSGAHAAVAALANAAKIPVRGASPVSRRAADSVERSAARMGMEARAGRATLADLEAWISHATPALIEIQNGAERGFVAIVRGGARHVHVVTPTGSGRVATEALVAAIERPLTEPFEDSINVLLEKSGVAVIRRGAARKAILREWAGGASVEGIWLIGLPASAPFLSQLSYAGVARHVAIMLGAHLAQYIIVIAGWWTIGRAALAGHIDRGWLYAWALLILTLLPLRLAEIAAQGKFATDGGALFKRRILEGALRLQPQELREAGVGQLLGRTLEADVIESMASSRAVEAITAGLDLAAAAIVLTSGAAPLAQLLVLGAVIGTTIWQVRRLALIRHTWTRGRLGLTHDLVENMVGHRTRIAQQSSEHWHDEEDGALTQYYESARKLDSASVIVVALCPAAWLLLGLGALIPSLVLHQASAASMAVSVGGVLLGFRAIRQLAAGARDLTIFTTAWRRARLLLERGAGVDPIGEVAQTTAPVREQDSPIDERAVAEQEPGPVLSAQNLVFRHRREGEPTLNGCSLKLAQKSRVLLEGPSGGGKSTLALVLAGVYKPEAGTLLAGGLDIHTTGPAEWRRHVVAVPQFHENHVLSSSFAFNLLMGRSWPPSAEDLALAHDICHDLGLGDLLQKMPSGLDQVVGEKGWQLSHGERSRLFIARALLQSPAVMILDESFAALDPITMQRALACVSRRANALIVVAHP